MSTNKSAQEILNDAFTSNSEISVNPSVIQNSVTLISNTGAAKDAVVVQAVRTNLSALKFTHNYRNIAIKARCKTVAATAGIITATVSYFLAASGGTALKTVSSAFVLTTAGQVEVYNILPDDMWFDYLELTLTGSGGAGAETWGVDAYLLYK